MEGATWGIVVHPHYGGLRSHTRGHNTQWHFILRWEEQQPLSIKNAQSPANAQGSCLLRHLHVLSREVCWGVAQLLHHLMFHSSSIFVAQAEILRSSDINPPS